MNSRRTPSRFAAPGALLLTVSFALVGCGQGSGDESADSGPPVLISVRLMDLNTGDDNRQVNHYRYENVVQTCMEEKGFEYSPEPLDQGFGMLSYLVPSADDPVADAEENGYQITLASKEALVEWYGHFGEAPDDNVGSWPDDETADDAASWPDETTDEDLGSWPDDEFTGDGVTEEAFGFESNEAYYRNLSASRQAAYDEALSGPKTKNGKESTYDWTAAGCYGEANHEVYQDRVPDLQAHLDSTVIDDYYTYTDDKGSNDPRTLEAEAGWVSCMADKGYDFTEPIDAQVSIQQRFAALTNNDVSTKNLEQLPDEELVALHDDEIATATADAQCTVDTGLEDVYDEVYRDVDAEFYNAHRAEVDAWFEAEEALRQ